MTTIDKAHLSKRKLLSKIHYFLLNNQFWVLENCDSYRHSIWSLEPNSHYKIIWEKEIILCFCNVKGKLMIERFFSLWNVSGIWALSFRELWLIKKPVFEVFDHTCNPSSNQNKNELLHFFSLGNFFEIWALNI